MSPRFRKKSKKYLKRPGLSTFVLVVIFLIVFQAIVFIAQKVNSQIFSATTDPVIVAVGDIACDPSSPNLNVVNGVPLGKGLNCRMKYTADLVKEINPVAILGLGDMQYENGALSKYSQVYDPSGWGSFKSKTYVTSGGGHDQWGVGDFYKYFGTKAGPSISQTWYSFDLGNWHIIQLNMNCDKVNCTTERTWFQNDLKQNPDKCLLAFWHFPHWGSGLRGSGTSAEDVRRRNYSLPFIQDFYNAHGDLILNGHDHDYERFALQNPNGELDPKGVREIVVGTGGININKFIATVPNREAGNANTVGVLKLTLHQSSYDWHFVPAKFTGNGTFTDSGSTNCHNVAPTTTPTPTPTPSPNTPPVSQTVTLTASEDTFADAPTPDTNYGNASDIWVDGDPTKIVYMKFDLSTLGGKSITNAKLRVKVGTNGSRHTQNVKQVSDSNWSESSLTFNNQPSVGNLLGTISSGDTTNVWSELDITSFISTNKGTTITIGLDQSGTDGIVYKSRESIDKPQLIVNYTQ